MDSLIPSMKISTDGKETSEVCEENGIRFFLKQKVSRELEEMVKRLR